MRATPTSANGSRLSRRTASSGDTVPDATPPISSSRDNSYRPSGFTSLSSPPVTDLAPPEPSSLAYLGPTGTFTEQALYTQDDLTTLDLFANNIGDAGCQALANACATTKYGGIVTACGLAQGFDLPATVMPFILRGVTLVGIDSVYQAKVNRVAAWQRE